MNEKNIKESEKTIYAAFQKNKKRIFINIILSVLITFVAVAIFGTQIFYPYHVWIALAIYIISFIPLLRNIFLSRKNIKEYKEYALAESFLKKQKTKIVVGCILLLGILSFWAVRPANDNPFAGMHNVQIQKIVDNDLYVAITALDYLESTGNILLETLETDQQNTLVSESIKGAFDEFLRAVIFSELLTDKHRYFDNISKDARQTREESFMISYALYIKKYEIVHQLLQRIDKNDYKKKILNQYVTMYDRNNIYNEMSLRYYHPKTRLRIAGGNTYIKKLSLFNAGVTDEFVEKDRYTFLKNSSQQSYRYLIKNFDKTLANFFDVYVSDVKTRVFDSWFPIQKGVANTMGHIVISERGNTGIIEPVDAQQMQKSMEPGDIMLQRRNWHMTNVGIPGFWTHAAVYVGDIEYADKYFASEFPYKGYGSFRRLLENEHRSAYEQYQKSDALGKYAVVEAIEPGVVFQSLEKSTDADFVVVLRANVSKREKLEAFLSAFGHVGKPYDYNFDFDTQDALVCSELVYDIYYPKSGNKGVHFETGLVNGRKIVSPLDMANKFKNERKQLDAELDFVYFLKSDEETKTTGVGTEDEFVESIGWSKFSFLQ